MIIDYRSSGSPLDFEADLCIVGAGVAGLAIANAFAGSRHRVCVLESGGLAGEERSQALHDGTSVGAPSFDPGGSRLRMFGGSCNLWGGGCIPFGPLAARDWVANSGWPIGSEELQAHYGRAQAFCGIGSHAFDEDGFLATPACAPLEFDSELLVHRMFAFSPLLFGDACRAQMASSGNIEVVLHANLLELLPGPDGAQVQRARIGSLEGRRGEVRARHYVLASGGIENARQLLLSDSVVPGGLGNGAGLVGRYFMDHPSAKLGTVRCADPYSVARPYDRNIDRAPGAPFPEICLTAQAQRQLRILAGRVRPFAIEGEPPAGIRALRELRAALRERRITEHDRLARRLSARHNGEPVHAGRMPANGDLARLAVRTAAGAGDLARAWARRRKRRPTVAPDHVALVGYFEQEPNPASRVTLADERDPLGQRKVCMEWRLTSLDRRTYRTAATVFGSEIARTCGGEFRPEPWLADDAAEPQVYSTSHHMGTTRMADSPLQGVVDRDCRVHGIDNLFVAGSSVFPTGNWAFPTFTIVTLSLRLAEHLRARLEIAATLATMIG